MAKVPILINIFIFTAISLGAQPSYTFTRYLERNGIPTTTVEKIIQDNNGYLWLASWSGLYRFDGIDFSNYRRGPNDTWTIPAQGRLADVLCDAYDHLWLLSYNNALYRFNPGSGETVRQTSSPILSIFKLSETDFRFVGDNGNILRSEYSKDGSVCSLSEYLTLPEDESVNSIFADSAGSIWILTDRGIWKDRKKLTGQPGFSYAVKQDKLFFGSSKGKVLIYGGGKLKPVPSGLEGDIKFLAPIAESSEFLAGSPENGLFCVDPDSGRIDRITGRFWFSRRPEFETDKAGNIWIYSEKGGLYWYDKTGRQLLPFYNSSLQTEWNAETYINSMLVDNQGNLWISGSWGGLERASPNSGEFRLKTIDKDPEAPESANNVRAVFQSSAGILYVATRDDKVHLLDSSLEEIAVWPSYGQVYSIAETKDGTIWLGSKGGGITENTSSRSGSTSYSPRRYRKGEDYYAPNSDLIYDLNTEDENRLWISSFDGSLSYIDLSEGSREFISRKNLISFPTEQLNMVRYSCFGPDRKLYACGNLGLFVCEDPEGRPEEMKFQRFSRIRGYDIQHLLFTKDGKLWASSSGNGFISFDNTDSDSSFKLYTTGNGLMSNFVLSAIQDNSGNIWIASNGGLNKFNPETGSIIGYSYSRMGLDMTFNEGEPILAKDGNIYFNTSKGLMYFNPETVSNSSYVPRILIHTLSIPGKRNAPKANGKVRMMKWDVLNVLFSAIDLTAPERVLYYYKLEGRDKNWRNLGSNPFVRIEGLKPGKYTLKLRSTNADGLAVDNEREILIRVGRGPLQYIILGLLLAAAAAAAMLTHKPRPVPATNSGEEEDTDTEERIFRKQFTSWLSEHMDDGDLDIAAMAAAMNMSRSALFEKCRTHIGMAPIEYLRKMRFQKATEMLASDEWSISQIAYATGFNDSHYFSKAFKQKFGMTPSAYRKARLKDSTSKNPPSSAQNSQ